MSLRVVTGAFCAGLIACIDREPMELQERPDAYRASAFFEDGRVMRPAVPNAVAQESYRATAQLPEARTKDGGWTDVFPVPVSVQMVRGGRAHFEVYCAPCHGLLADGNGPVARKMTLRLPPALVRSQSAVTEKSPPASSGVLPHPLGFYFSVVTEGYGLMPSYADVLTSSERWAVIAYLRALSFSQSTPLSEVPPEVQARLLREAP